MTRSFLRRVLGRQDPFETFGSSGHVSATTRQLPLVIGSQGLRFLFFFASTYLMTTLVAPAEFGRLLMVGVPVSMVSLFGDLGLGDGVVRSKGMDSSLASFFFWANLAMGAAASLVLLLVMPAFEAWFDGTNLWDLGLAFAGLILLNGLVAQYRALLRRQLRLDALSVSEIGVTVVSSVACVSFAFFGWGAVSIPIGRSLGIVFEIMALVQLTGWIPGRPARFERAREIFAFGWRLALSGVFHFGMSAVSVFLLGRYYSAESLGFIERAGALSQGIIQRFSGVVMRVSYPLLSRQVHVSEKKGNQLASRLVLFASDLWIIPLACVIGLADPIVKIAFGEDWAGLGYYLTWAYVGLAFWFPGRFANSLLLAKGHSGLLLQVNSVLFLIRMVVTIVGVMYGLEVYVALVGGSEAISSLVLIGLAGRRCNVDWWVWVKRCVFAAMIGAVCFSILKIMIPIVGDLPSLFTVAVVLLVAVLARIRSSSEFRYVWSEIRGRTNMKSDMLKGESP